MWHQNLYPEAPPHPSRGNYQVRSYLAFSNSDGSLSCPISPRKVTFNWSFDHLTLFLQCPPVVEHILDCSKAVVCGSTSPVSLLSGWTKIGTFLRAPIFRNKATFVIPHLDPRNRGQVCWARRIIFWLIRHPWAYFPHWFTTLFVWSFPIK